MVTFTFNDDDVLDEMLDRLREVYARLDASHYDSILARFVGELPMIHEIVAIAMEIESRVNNKEAARS